MIYFSKEPVRTQIYSNNQQQTCIPIPRCPAEAQGGPGKWGAPEISIQQDLIPAAILLLVFAQGRLSGWRIILKPAPRHKSHCLPTISAVPVCPLQTSPLA
jgi:hypothetical protein